MAEKKYPPTSKRLRDARRRGEVVFSADVASTVVFVGVLAAGWLLTNQCLDLVRELWLHATGPVLLADPAAQMFQLLLHAQVVLLYVAVPVALLVLLGGVAGSFAQVGGVAAWHRLAPDANRLNPAEGLQRIFSARSAVNLLKMIVKTGLLAALIFVVIRGLVETALKLGYGHPSTVMVVAGRLLAMTFGWAAVVYALMAAIDYVHQRYEFMKQQRMSIEELQREYKEAEGDPLSASRRRSEHFETVYMGIDVRVRAASAVIRSQRVAVALQYLGEKDLPRVIARGEGARAHQIVRIATEALVPVEEGADLAERLYDEVPQGQAVPRSLYVQVAKLLRWAQGLE